MIAGTAAEEEAKLLPPAWVINASKYVLAAAAGHKGARVVDNYPSMLALSNINSELRRTATRLNLENIMTTNLESLERSMNQYFDALEKSLKNNDPCQ